MTIRRCVHVALVLGAALFLMAASASAVSITYSTAGLYTTGSGPGIGTATYNASFGETVGATLSFALNASSTSGVPSGINLGDFLLACPHCGTAASLDGAFFQAFTFKLTVTDTTDGGVLNPAVGYFLGTSTGGNVYSDASNIIINWGTLQLVSGNFGTTSFAIYTPTPIVAPNSGTPLGDTTVQGTVNSSAVPEPATLGLIGGGLLGLGVVLRRKKRA